jgi:hypothetical protein
MSPQLALNDGSLRLFECRRLAAKQTHSAQIEFFAF